MGIETQSLTDGAGRPMFICPRCRQPLTAVDLIAQDLRLPDPGEAASDFLDAELLDDLSHLRCSKRQSA